MRRLCIGLVMAAGIASGCASPGRVTYNTSKSQEEAASIHVAVQSVQPWDEAKVSLSTNFKLTEAEALLLSLPTTSLQEQEDARRIMGSLGLSLPTTTVTKTDSYTDDRLKDGVQTDSFTREEKTTRAEAADPTQPTVTRSSNRIPDALRTLQSDPFIQAQTARNLIHYYALLNQEIDNVALPEGAKAYIVRLQVTVSPNKRRQPYDVTIDLATFQTAKTEELFAKERESGATPLKGPELLPLVITDQVERSLQSQAELVAMQLALSAQGGLGQVGARASGGYASESLRNALGAQYNSLYSLAQLNGNTLRVRFGAQSIGGTYETVTRNHLVTFLMIVPAEVANADTWAARQFELVTRAYVSDARDGRRMEIANELDGLRATTDEFGHFYDIYGDFALNCSVPANDQHQNFGEPYSGCVSNSLFGELKEKSLYATSNNDAERRFNARRIAHLARAAQEGDFGRFNEIIKAPYSARLAASKSGCGASYTAVALTVAAGPQNFDCQATTWQSRINDKHAVATNEGRIKTLYLELQRLRGAPRMASFINLPRVRPADYPVRQSTFVEYDDKTSKARLYGGWGLDRKRLSGLLVVKEVVKDAKDAEAKAFYLPATSAEFDGKKVDLTFTSLTALGDLVKLGDAKAWLCLRSPRLAPTNGLPDAKPCPVNDPEGGFAAYEVVLPKKKGALPDVGSLVTTADGLTAVGGAAQARVQIALGKDVAEGVLTVSNATLKDASLGAPHGLGRLYTSADASADKPKVVTLDLENLTPGADVTLTLSPKEGVTTHGPKTKTLKVTAASK